MFNRWFPERFSIIVLDVDAVLTVKRIEKYTQSIADPITFMSRIRTYYMIQVNEVGGWFEIDACGLELGIKRHSNPVMRNNNYAKLLTPK